MRFPLSLYLAILTLSLLLPACTSRLLREAETAEARGEYHQAMGLYKQLYQRTPREQRAEKARLAFRSGENARCLRAFASARTSYHSALKYQYPDSLLLIRLAEVALATGAYQEALTFARRYLRYDSASREARLLEESAGFALRTAHPSFPSALRYKVTQSGHLSSSRSDYGVAYSPEGKTIYFTSHRRPSAGVSTQSPITGEGLGRIYALHQGANASWLGKVDTLVGLTSPQSDIGTPTFTPDGRTMYYTRSEQGKEGVHTAQIYMASQGEDGAWSEGKPFSIFEDSTVLVAHPSLSPSGKTLFFVSDVAGGRGGKDLYRMSLEHGGIGAIYNLGEQVNSPRDELFPYAVSDSVVYFASEGWMGYGGLDVYRATLLPDGGYELHHLPYPINTHADDYGFAPAPIVDELSGGKSLREVGFLASSRDDLRGVPHLYRFELEKVETIIEGIVSDREGYPLSGVTLSLVGNRREGQMQAVTTDQQGSYRLPASADTDYVMLASAQGYLNQYVRLHTDPSDSSEVYTVDFYLAQEGRHEPLREVYYAFDSAEILPESTPSLDSLLQLMRDNPQVQLTLLAHADRHGTDVYNAALSQRRAHALVGWLVSRGVAESRLRSEGYGKARPFVVTRRVAEEYPFLTEGQVLDEVFIATLPEDQQRQCDALNRRTEFRAVSSW